MTEYRAIWDSSTSTEVEGGVSVVEVGSAEAAERFLEAGWRVERREVGAWQEINLQGTTYRAFEDFRYETSTAWEAIKDEVLGKWRAIANRFTPRRRGDDPQ